MAVCRFAPSPTGLLHVGGARTALFNWAFARHEGGRFLLRMEDTDRERSSAANERSIVDALAWLGLEPDGETVRQSERGELYRACADRLLGEGLAYRCYATPGELDALRREQEARGQKPMYDRRWRGRTDRPEGKGHCLRFATPLDGSFELDDAVCGRVTVANSELDDPVILRADGSATYNFAAAVDDGEMGITHVIRGEDHLTNTVRQAHIHAALGNALPRFAHLPLILGRKVAEDGTEAVNEQGEPAYERLSKRNMAVDVEHYRKEGFLPGAMVNYLAQLGWTQPDAEVYMPEDLAREFELSRVNRSAARFDIERLLWINREHMRLAGPERLAELAETGAPARAVEIACEKSRTLNELRDELQWLDEPSGTMPELLAGQLGEDNLEAFIELCEAVSGLGAPDAKAVKTLVRDACKASGLKFPRLGMPLRVALTGRLQSPDIGDVAEILGADECRKRLAAAAGAAGGLRPSGPRASP